MIQNAMIFTRVMLINVLRAIVNKS